MFFTYLFGDASIFIPVVVYCMLWLMCCFFLLLFLLPLLLAPAGGAYFFCCCYYCMLLNFAAAQLCCATTASLYCWCCCSCPPLLQYHIYYRRTRGQSLPYNLRSYCLPLLLFIFFQRGTYSWTGRGRGEEEEWIFVRMQSAEERSAPPPGASSHKVASIS